MQAVTRTFVGRERELVDLEAGLEEVLAGRGQLYLVSGEAGVGKTRLCDELALRASDRGLLVRWGRCWEVGGAPAYWPWIQLLRALMRERQVTLDPHARDMLGRLLPELAGASPSPGQLDSAEQRFQLFDAVTALLRDSARDRPLLVILDDLHAADPSSLALLLFVARELRDLRLCVIGTYRDKGVLLTPDAREALARVAREAQTLAVARFSVEETRALLHSRSGAVDDHTLGSVFSATEGLPLFVAEVARARPTAGHWVVPDTIRAALKARVDAVPREVRDVLEAAAVLGRETSRTTLAAVLGLTESQLQPQLSAALASGIAVEPEPNLVSFSHALLRDAIYRELPETRRLELHERAADLLERAQAPESAWGEVANHLLAARERVGTERAMRGSLRAAQRALRTYAFEDAIAIVEQALDALGNEPIDPRLHCELLILLGESQIRSYRNGLDACLRAAAIARELGDATLLAQAALALGAEIWAGRVSTTLVSVLQEALAALPVTPSPLRARVMARLAGAMQPAMDPMEPVALAREAIAMARAIGDETSLRMVLLGAGAALVDYAPVPERIDVDSQTLMLAEAAHDWPLAFRARIRLYFDHLERGVWPDAEVALRGCEALAKKLRRPRLQWYVTMLHALRANVTGDFEPASRLREEAQQLLAGEDDESLRSPFQLHDFATALLRHEHDSLLDKMPALQPQALPAEFAEAVRATLLAIIHARMGRRDQASATMGRLDLNAPSLRHEIMSMYLLADTCLVSQVAEHAAVIVKNLQPFRESFVTWGVFGFGLFGPVVGLQAGLLALLGRYDEALPMFEDAAVRCEQLRARPALARTHYDHARALLARGQPGDRERALARLDDAERMAREMQMPGLMQWIEAARAPAAVSGRPASQTEPARALAALDATTFTLVREGDVWLVTHGPRVFRLKHSRGLTMLAQLVDNPGREIHALALGADGDPGDLGDAGSTVDAKAVRAYRARLEELREREQTAEALSDSAAAERARTEIESIAQHLSAALGLGGKGRKTASASERARVNVQRRIKDAIGRIAREDAELGRYLGLCVRTGTFSMFKPLR